MRAGLLTAAVLVLLPGARAVTPPAARAQNSETPAFHHLHLNSADPAAAVRFYQRHFTTVEPATVAGFTGFRTGHVLVLLSKRTGRPPAGQSAYWHFGWHVPSAQGSWERYRTSGAPLTPLHTDDGRTVTFSNEWLPGTLTRAAAAAARERGAKATAGGYGYLTGPDGEWIEYAGDHPAERFNHVHMFQEQVFCAELWYQRHFGVPISQSARRAEGRKTSEADCDVATGEPSWLSLVPQGTMRQPAGGVAFGDVELNWYQRQGGQPLVGSRGHVMDHVGLQVSGLSNWLARLRQNGVRILKAPYRFGSGRAAMVEGPSLEAIELIEVP
ncbi:MAG: VOC family protein [Vicinamibacterales bacterium]